MDILEIDAPEVVRSDCLAGDRWVSMHNALIRAGHGLSLSEKRLVAIALSKIDSRKPVPHGQILTTKITAFEYAELFSVDTDTAYNQLFASSKHLMNRVITYGDSAKKSSGKSKRTAWTDMRWVGRCTYHGGEGWVELAWWPEILPVLTNLKKNFTSYQLHQTSALRSVYSWRLLELMMRFKDTGWTEIDITAFAVAMDATEKQRADFGKLRTKMIEPAIRELTEKDGWLIQWESIKTGRKVKALRFEFQRNPQHQLPL